MRNLQTAAMVALLLASVTLLGVGVAVLFDSGSDEASAGDFAITWAKDTPGIGAKEHPLPMPSTKTLEESLAACRDGNAATFSASIPR